MNIPETNNLSTFRILFIIKGILTLFLSLLAVLYMGVGFFLASSQEFNQFDEGFPLPFNPGLIFVFVGGFIFLLLVTLGILTIIAAKYMNERRGYSFIFGVAIVNCFTGILGILLGVFAIIELSKPEVKELFTKKTNSMYRPDA